MGYVYLDSHKQQTCCFFDIDDELVGEVVRAGEEAVTPTTVAFEIKYFHKSPITINIDS